MPGEVLMPRLGWGGETGKLVEWLKRDGDTVLAGEAICTVEGDKANVDVETLDAGVLRIPPESPPVGADVPVGTLLAYVIAPGNRAPIERTGPAPATPVVAEQRPHTSALAAGTAERSAPVAKDALLALYRQMVQIRKTEEQLVRAHQAGLVHGACHTYIGEEAVAAGVCAHLRADDPIFSTHRGHGHALAKGVPPVELIAELLGRATGCSHGRGGSMHLFAPDVGVLGTSGIVGPSILMAAGAGYTFKLRRSDRVSVAFFGDGATNNGAFHEGLNLARIWDLPTLFVCENNLYATEVPFSTVAGNANVAERGRANGIASERVDGNDVTAVYAAAGAAIRRARAGQGPTLLECLTYRTRAHSEGMRDAGYRTRDEVEAWRARDPILTLQRRLIGEGVISAASLEAIEATVQQEVDRAFALAKDSPWPDPATATAHVYSEG